MNDQSNNEEPRTLVMHKRPITMPDGKRQMIFYTYEVANTSERPEDKNSISNG